MESGLNSNLKTPNAPRGREASIPISEYAKKLEADVKKRYLVKIQCVGIDPVLLQGKNFEPDCFPPLESADILSYLVLETSYYTKEEFKNYRSLEAFNQLVSGFVTSVQGHKILDKFCCLGKSSTLAANEQHNDFCMDYHQRDWCNFWCSLFGMQSRFG